MRYEGPSELYGNFKCKIRQSSRARAAQRVKREGSEVQSRLVSPVHVLLASDYVNESIKCATTSSLRALEAVAGTRVQA